MATISIPTPVSTGITFGKVVGGVIVIGGVIYGVKKFKNYLDKENEKKQLLIDQGTTIKPPPGKKVFYDLNGKPITSANLSTIAADLEDALSFPVDQARVIRVFQSTPFGSVKDLETFYLNKYGENLKQRMIDKLSDSNWIKIKFNFR
jgi:hypothetical protein